MTSDLRALLLNAIYFKGQWSRKFDKGRTRQKDFRVSETERTPVQIMSQLDTFEADYFDDLDAKVLALPYRNSNLYMLIFLPIKVDGLSQLEDKIKGFNRPLTERRVYVWLPKFKIEFKEVLNNHLQTLGIRDAFSPTANLEGLVNNSGLYISKVLQKAFVEVNEEGAEAAAATVLHIMPISAGWPKSDVMQFKADHPFAFIIRDEKTVYFQGHVVKP